MRLNRSIIMNASVLLALIASFMLSPTANRALAQDGTATLSGTVTNGVNGEPLGGVTVTLATSANVVETIIAPYSEDAVRRFEVVTESDGSYIFENVLVGDYVIFAEGTDLADLRPITLVLEDEEDQVVDFEMTPGGSILGTVTSANEIPIFGGAVTLFNRQLAIETAYIRSDGTFLFPNVAPGNEYQLFVQTPTEAALSVSRLAVLEGEVLTINTVVDEAATLSGRVVDDQGAPIYKAAVAIESSTLRWSGVTDQNGFYELNGAGIEYNTIVPGTYDVRVRADGHESNFEGSVDLTQPQPYVQNFTLNRAGVVTGVILSADGIPLENVTVSAVGEVGSEYATLTQPDGTYSLDLLDASQPYTLTALTTGYVPVSVEGISADIGETVSGVDFTLDPASYVQGIVQNSDGDGVANAVIDFYAEGELVATEVSDGDGMFASDGLIAGNYVVHVILPSDGLSHIDTVAVGDDTTILELDLDVAGSLTGTAEDAQIVVLTFEDVVVTVQAVNEDGSYEITNLPAGTYDVTAYSADSSSETTSATIEAGSETDLDLVLE